MTKQMFVLIVIAVYVFGVSFFYEPNTLTVTNYKIEDRQLQGIKIAFLSDLHLKKNEYKRLDRIVELTKKQNPDLVLVGGDFVNNNNLKKTMKIGTIGDKLKSIGPAVVTVLGNHDWHADGKHIALELSKSNIVILENSSRRLYVKNRQVDIVGLADLKTRKVNISRALYGTREPRIVLMHNPDSYYDIMDRVSLILAGHTHGGQFVLPFSPPIFVPSKYGTKFAGGLISETSNKMIISRGLGTSIVPLRLNCKPEVVIVEFVKPGTQNASTGLKKRRRKAK